MARDHKAMIQNPERWPHGYILPVKRPNAASTEGLPYDFGLILLGGLTTVVLAGLYDSGAERAAAKRLEYATVEALLADGWVVD